MAADDNQRGDLFGRLVCDVFHSLGYENFRLNVNRTGREIDIKGRHRAEQKAVIAECKAMKRPVGGSDLNKFAGASQVEAQGTQAVVAPYFVSLGGFTSSALEQEREAGARMTLLDANAIVGELIRGRVIVSKERALSATGPAVGRLPAGASLSGHPTLIAHEIGWVWAIFFQCHGEETHFTLVHADGHGIADSLAGRVLSGGGGGNTIFAGLKYVSSVTDATSSVNGEVAKDSYLQFLLREFGAITLEGLPADQETGSRVLRLDSLYVPQRFVSTVKSKMSGGDPFDIPEDETPDVLSTRKLLDADRHVAVLAGPGSGKTTLIKMLAVSYADPDRRRKFAGSLPVEDLMPLVIRCRQLGSRTREPIVTTLFSLIEQAERIDLKREFAAAVSQALKSGRVLLLVDGLDEISDAQERLTFTTQLRTFIGTYPTIRVVCTSREAGFRAVAGAVASICRSYKIADLSLSDIEQLCVSWHREIQGHSPASMSAAAESFSAVTANPRVYELAVNPLLLMTLLLVKRWMGEIPTKRTVLYSKAIEVLLMTWNTQGHEPMDPEDALPQLAFAAFSMLTEDKQSASARELRDLFNRAREEMPELLSFSKLSADGFIRRVEERSSLIVQSGSTIERGLTRPLYEFKHLTFQEYLAALACAESWHPGRDYESDPVSVLKPYLENETWTEVIPLASVLSGIKHAKCIVRELIDRIKASNPEDMHMLDEEEGEGLRAHPLYRNLLGCITDGAPIHPDLVRESLETLVDYWDGESSLATHFRGSRILPVLGDLLWERYETGEGLSRHGDLLSQVYSDLYEGGAKLSDLIADLRHSDERRVVGAALGLMAIFYGSSPHIKDGDTSSLKQTLRELVAGAATLQVKFAVTWALCWALPYFNWSKNEVKLLLEVLIRQWRSGEHREMSDFSAWAISILPVEGIRFSRGEIDVDESGLADLVRGILDGSSGAPGRSKQAALRLAYFSEDFFTDDEVLGYIEKVWPREQRAKYRTEPFADIRSAINQPVLFSP
ncbi:NACHT domain-containing protein [Streptomyces sp. NBC_01635]|uniref:NACHT domain-containing protein n=1 Tax=Streptomyces sp. NBC_01635 TaxID=2975904 RepID=UPI00386BFB42|nr:NACHT domain-containing protein [Streptomyces sp. NBC_01635]